MSTATMTRVDQSAGARFLRWLERPEVLGRGDGAGAFARWVVAAVEDGEVQPKWVRYPKKLEQAPSGQFGLEDWKDAWFAYVAEVPQGTDVEDEAMYKKDELVYCSGNGNDEGERSCWVDGECRGPCAGG